MPLFTRVHCVTSVTPTFRVDSSEKGLMVVMFCSDLSEKDVKKIVSFITPAFVLDAVCESL